MPDKSAVELHASDYYGRNAYRPDAIPPQDNQQEELNRTGLERSASLRLPWGNTCEVMPSSFLSAQSPKKLRKLEKREDLAKKIGLQSENNHECFRYAQLAFRARFFNMMNVLGKLGAIILTPIVLLTLLIIWLAYSDESSPSLLPGMVDALEMTLLPVYGMWLVSFLVIRLFPGWVLKAGRGPEWELNRRTGMVTVWRYPRKFPLVPSKPPVVIEKPFYEFDAWCCARVDRHGPLYDLVLSHRYSKLDVTVGDILGSHGHPNICYAFWDYIQNYMDTSRSLPEDPLLEEYRPLDPVTAEHDRRTGRPERYWRDMDMDTFKDKVNRMHTDVTIINTAARPNLMEQKLRYAS